MKVITFSSMKGGTGKSSTSILTANCLAAAGKKVCVVDMDINNSCSFTYLEEQDDSGQKNIAVALQSADLSAHTRPTVVAGIDIIESSLYLVDLRSMPINRLSIKINTLSAYDFVIIDTSPAYDNLLLAAMDAADIIITPVLLTQYDFNTARFLSNKLQSETNFFNKWFLTINGYNKRFEKFKNSSQADYLDLFSSHFDNFISSDCYFPWTTQVRRYIDRGEKIKNTEQYEKLRKSIIALTSFVANETIIIEGEF